MDKDHIFSLFDCIEDSLGILYKGSNQKRKTKKKEILTMTIQEKLEAYTEELFNIVKIYNNKSDQ